MREEDEKTLIQEKIARKLRLWRFEVRGDSFHFRVSII